MRLSVPQPEIRVPKLCQFWGASPPKIFGATAPHIFYPFERPRALLHVWQISAAGWKPCRRYGRRCATTPSKKAVFCTFPKVTNMTASSPLTFTRGAAIPLPRDTASTVGQLCAYIFFLRGTPCELQPPQTFEFHLRGPNLAPAVDYRYKDIFALI